MAAAWKTVRVFISSTFRDMHGERDHLVRVVFPELRERLYPHRIDLIDIDLRWGVTREQAENDRVLDVCLEQVDRCRPFFLSMLGERYGWVPESSPAVARYGWVQHEMGRSLTELEILFGALLMDPVLRGRAFFYFRDPAVLDAIPEDVRRSVYAETDPESIRKLSELKARIRRSGYPVYDGYPARWDPDAHDRSGRTRGRLAGLAKFGDRVRDQLWEAIRAEHHLTAAAPPPDVLVRETDEADDHERFLESRLQVYVGREDLHAALVAHANGGGPHPCLVTGPSGSGKSSALARLVVEYRRAHPDALVVSHFVGAAPRSAGLRDMLRRLCRALADHRGFRGEIPEEINPLAATFRELIAKAPPDRRVLVVIDALDQLEEADRHRELWWLPSGFPSHVRVLVSGASDPHSPQAEAEPTARAFRHRPHHTIQVGPLSEGERLGIIHRVPSLSAKSLDERQAALLLANPSSVNPLYLRVALEELRGFGSFERLDARIAALPRPGLADDVVEHAGFTPALMQRAGDPVTALFVQVIERLEGEFDRELVRDVLTFLASARRGLSEAELQGLVAELRAADDLPVVLRQLRPYLFSRNGLLGFFHRDLLRAARTYYLDTDEARRAAVSRLADYLGAGADWLEPAEARGGPSGEGEPSRRLPNVRKADELPWLRLQARQWWGLAALGTQISFLEASAEAGLVFDLVAVLGSALRAMPPADFEAWFLGLLEEALRTEIHLISRHPRALFACLWNRCWWYDCPDAAAHYEPPEGGWPPEGGPWARRGLKLHQIAEDWWLHDKRSRTPAFSWLRSRRPPPIPLGTPARAVLRGHAKAVVSLAFSPDGTRLASASTDRTARLWSVDDGAPLSVLRSSDELKCVAFTRDGARVYTGAAGYDFSFLHIWNAASGERIGPSPARMTYAFFFIFSPDAARVAGNVYQHLMLKRLDDGSGSEIRAHDGAEPADPRSLAFSPDGTLLAAGLDDGDVLLVCASDSSVVSRIPAQRTRVVSIAVSPCNTRLASGADDGMIRIWDLSGERLLHGLTACGDRIAALAFSPDGTLLAAGAADSVELWDVEGGAHRACFRGHEDQVTSLAFSPDGQLLASGSVDATVRTWDVHGHRNRNPPRLRGHRGEVTCCGFAADGSRVVTGGSDGAVFVWDAGSGMPVTELRGLEGPVGAVACSRDGRQVVGADDGAISLWETDSEGPPASILLDQTEFRHSPTSVALSPDGGKVASGSLDGTVILWRCHGDDRGLEDCLFGHEGRVEEIAFSGDGSRLLSASVDGTVRLWDLTSGTPLARLPRLRPDLLDTFFPAVSPEGRPVSGGIERMLRTWEAARGIPLAFLRGWEARVWCVGFDPQDALAAIGLTDGSLMLWDVARGRMLDHSPGHKRQVTCAAFSPDGMRLVTGSSDGTVFGWSLGPGGGGDGRRLHNVALLGKHDGEVVCAAFSDDGRYLATGSRDHTVTVVRFDSGEPPRRYTKHESDVTCVAFKPGSNGYSNQCASGSKDGIVRKWGVGGLDMHDDRCPLAGQSVLGVAISDSPNGSEYAFRSSDGRVHLRDVNAYGRQTFEPKALWWDPTVPFLARAMGDDASLVAYVDLDTIVVRSLKEPGTVGWFPAGIQHHAGAVHPSGRAWAGWAGSDLILLALE